MKTSSIKSMVSALLFVVAGILLGYSAGWWDFIPQPAALWSLLLIIPALAWMFILGINIVNSIAFFAGIGLLMYLEGFIEPQRIVFLIIALSVMSLALSVIGGSLNSSSFNKLKTSAAAGFDQKNIQAKAVIKDKHYVNNIKESVLGGTLKTTCSTLIYNFSGCTLETDIDIEATVNGGRMIIVVPSQSKVVINSRANFGSVSDNTKKNSNAYLINVNAAVRFGELIIANEL